MNAELLSELRDQLERERDRLIDDRRLLSDEARGTNVDSAKNSPAEVGTENFVRDTELGQASLDQSLVNEILAALQRMDDGSYGICEITGEDIPEERLRAVPWTRYTVQGQEQVEREESRSARSGRIVGDIDPVEEAASLSGGSAGASS